MNGEALKIESLVKRYGASLAVDNVSLDIRPGEFVSLLGPSGSGKTTTLMMIAGFETPSDGEIFLGSKPIVRQPVHKRNIGVVFQSYALFPHMTVYENVAFAMKMRGERTLETRSSVMAALELVQLGGFDKRMPHQLSGGQQQRVALARALVFKPGLVLMDEPLGALDKQLREHMQIELKRIQKNSGATMVFVTHDQSEALTMSDRIVVMNQGKIEQVGTPEEVYERPTTRFVASFIGESNFLKGDVVRAEGAEVLIKAGTQTLRAMKTISTSLEGTATLMVRPEKIHLVAGDSQAENQVNARVLDSMYWGNVVKYRFELDDPTRQIVTVSVPKTSSKTALVSGQSVRLGWNAADTCVLPT